MTVSVRFIFAVVCMLAPYIEGQEQEERSAPLVDQNISQVCFGCICEAASGCNTTVGCAGDTCGPFRITWAYWADGGKPTLNNEPNTADGAWVRCVNDAICASRAIQGYMNKYGKDCNGDGIINCDDYVRIHRLGAYACNSPLDQGYENTYRTCMATFGK